MQIIITNDAFDIVKIGEITFKLSIKKSFLKHLYCKHCGHRLALDGYYKRVIQLPDGNKIILFLPRLHCGNTSCAYKVKCNLKHYTSFKVRPVFVLKYRRRMLTDLLTGLLYKLNQTKVSLYLTLISIGGNLINRKSSTYQSLIRNRVAVTSDITKLKSQLEQELELVQIWIDTKSSCSKSHEVYSTITNNCAQALKACISRFILWATFENISADDFVKTLLPTFLSITSEP